MSAALERRYRGLLRAYPAGYRAKRGDEILGTLLAAAAPGQRRPGPRETAALLLAGVRARAAGVTRRTARETWLGGLRYAVLLALALVAVDAARSAKDTVVLLVTDGRMPFTPDRLDPIIVVLAGATLVAVAGGRRLPALAGLAGIVAAGAFGMDDDPMKWVGLLVGMPLLAAAVPATRRLPAVRHPWWALALLPALALAMRLPVLVPLDRLSVGLVYPVLLAAAVLGAPLDARIPLGVAGLLLYQELTSIPIAIRFGIAPDMRWYALLVGAMLVPLAVLGAWRARRQARL